MVVLGGIIALFLLLALFRIEHPFHYFFRKRNGGLATTGWKAVKGKGDVEKQRMDYIMGITKENARLHKEGKPLKIVEPIAKLKGRPKDKWEQSQLFVVTTMGMRHKNTSYVYICVAL